MDDNIYIEIKVRRGDDKTGVCLMQKIAIDGPMFDMHFNPHHAMVREFMIANVCENIVKAVKR